MVKQRGGVEVEDRRRELPRDSEQFSLGLEADSYLFRAPKLGWTVLLGVVTAGLGIAMSAEVSRHRTARRRRTDL